MTPEYLAGLFDGEGSVAIIHQKSPRIGAPKHCVHCLQVSITNTHFGVMQEVEGFLGYGHLRAKKQSSPTANIKTIYLWEARAQKAVRFLEVLLPYLIIKRERADIGLEFARRLAPYAHKRMYDRTWIFDYCDAMRWRNHAEGSARHLRFCNQRAITAGLARYDPVLPILQVFPQSAPSS